jgi:hypothetical protein
MHKTTSFYAPTKNSRKKRLLLGHVCSSVRLNSCNSATSARRIFVKFYFFKFLLNFVETFRLWPKSDKNKTLYFKKYFTLPTIKAN